MSLWNQMFLLRHHIKFILIRIITTPFAKAWDYMDEFLYKVPVEPIQFVVFLVPNFNDTVFQVDHFITLFLKQANGSVLMFFHFFLIGQRALTIKRLLEILDEIGIIQFTSFRRRRFLRTLGFLPILFSDSKSFVSLTNKFMSTGSVLIKVIDSNWNVCTFKTSSSTLLHQTPHRQLTDFVLSVQGTSLN